MVIYVATADIHSAYECQLLPESHRHHRPPNPDFPSDAAFAHLIRIYSRLRTLACAGPSRGSQAPAAAATEPTAQTASSRCPSGPS